MPYRLLSPIALLCLLAAPGLAQDAGPGPDPAAAEPVFRVGAGFGTAGVMLEPQVRLPHAALRGTFGYGATSQSFTIDSIDYDSDITVGQAGVLLDIHPLANGLRLSVGAVTSFDEASINATAPSITIGGTTYSGAVLEGTVEQESKVQPVLAVGYGSATRRWAVDFDIGARFQKGWSAELRNGSGSPVQISDADLRREEAQIEDDLNDIKVLPYAKIGISFSF